jgi:hypothetical protein
MVAFDQKRAERGRNRRAKKKELYSTRGYESDKIGYDGWPVDPEHPANRQSTRQDKLWDAFSGDGRRHGHLDISSRKGMQKSRPGGRPAT